MIHCHVFSSKTLTSRDLFEVFAVFAVLLRCYVQSVSFVGSFEGFCCRSWFALHSRFYRGLIISSLYSLSFLNDSNLFAKTRLSFITLLFFVLEVV